MKSTLKRKSYKKKPSPVNKGNFQSSRKPSTPKPTSKPVAKPKSK